MFTTIKVGYTAGIYGCSGEYFTTIAIHNDDVHAFNHYGMYGSEQRVSNVLIEAGYKELYTPSDFGKMTQRDVNSRGKFWKSEYQAIDLIHEYLSNA